METLPKGMVGWLLAHGWGAPDMPDHDVATVRILIAFFVMFVLVVLAAVLGGLLAPANMQ